MSVFLTYTAFDTIAFKPWRALAFSILRILFKAHRGLTQLLVESVHMCMGGLGEQNNF